MVSVCGSTHDSRINCLVSVQKIHKGQKTKDMIIAAVTTIQTRARLIVKVWIVGKLHAVEILSREVHEGYFLDDPEGTTDPLLQSGSREITKQEIIYLYLKKY